MKKRGKCWKFYSFSSTRESINTKIREKYQRFSHSLHVEKFSVLCVFVWHVMHEGREGKIRYWRIQQFNTWVVKSIHSLQIFFLVNFLHKLTSIKYIVRDLIIHRRSVVRKKEHIKWLMVKPSSEAIHWVKFKKIFYFVTFRYKQLLIHSHLKQPNECVRI